MILCHYRKRNGSFPLKCFSSYMGNSLPILILHGCVWLICHLYVLLLKFSINYVPLCFYCNSNSSFTAVTDYPIIIMNKFICAKTDFILVKTDLFLDTLVNIYLFKVNIKSTKERSKICLKLTTRHQNDVIHFWAGNFLWHRNCLQFE